MSSTKVARLTPYAQGQLPEEVMLVSSFAMIRYGNNLLLVKRIRPEFTANKWTFPASLINFGEHPEQAIKRVVKEQVGAEAKNVKLLAVQSYGDKHWDLCFVYDVTIDSVGNVSQDIEKAEYYEKDKLPPEFRADHLEVLQGLGSRV